ncbi:hypothetical protein FZI85_11065 [Mycobacterium sp. CBMA293]|nr:hypothetical protein [Mycolicibacterium sp. CBMA 360]MUL59077.1 hypothetical protein [Mycolicibacterium sp. CBMA 335]MUL69471.1 hypothetical protein [Mycolicibacterium sp. CBMA 311]MUL94435.1 hypothetical protein [Mycolicibacterium sp. CBMA 230]MUM06548.1 hypothetical protein [Mycolicibacterium sp. CBMA 213]MUM11564.1 hypothetical protein [Mycolicibacterium sp. CBMA 293]MUM32029.1 hypothetical protein [Mycolicibacterium sp. CBMA 361]
MTTIRGKSCLLLAGLLLAVSFVSAPAAGARQTCHDAGDVVRCETSGSVSLKATPQARAPHVGQINGDRNRRGGITWSW